MGVKLSVSVPDEDVVFLDDYAERRGFPSRSAVLQRAIRLLRTEGLADDYAVAIDEWSGSEDERLWGATTGDGLSDAPR